MSESPLQSYVEQVRRDQRIGLENMATMQLLESSMKACEHTSQANQFLNVIYNTAELSMLLALARILDHSPQTASLLSICNFAPEHPEQCEWLFGDSGTRRFPDGKAHLIRLCDRWREWWDVSQLRPRLKALRDKALAHHDKDVACGEFAFEPMVMAEISDHLMKIGEFVNDFYLVLRDCQYMDWEAYELTFRDGKTTMALAEAMNLMMIEQPLDGLSTKWTSPIERKIDVERKRITGHERKEFE